MKQINDKKTWLYCVKTEDGLEFVSALFSTDFPCMCSCNYGFFFFLKRGFSTPKSTVKRAYKRSRSNDMVNFLTNSLSQAFFFISN